MQGGKSIELVWDEEASSSLIAGVHLGQNALTEEETNGLCYTEIAWKEMLAASNLSCWRGRTLRWHRSTSYSPAIILGEIRLCSSQALSRHEFYFLRCNAAKSSILIFLLVFNSTEVVRASWLYTHTCIKTTNNKEVIIFFS